MAASLELEHGVSFVNTQRRMLDEAVAYCRATKRSGVPLIEKEDAVRRLARIATHIELEMIYYRALWSSAARKGLPALGPASKMFSSETFQSDAADLLNLMGQAVLSKDGAAGFMNLSYRHAHARTIYGGTSEVHRSMIAERALGMPRTRA